MIFTFYYTRVRSRCDFSILGRGIFRPFLTCHQGKGRVCPSIVLVFCGNICKETHKLLDPDKCWKLVEFLSSKSANSKLEFTSLSFLDQSSFWFDWEKPCPMLVEMTSNLIDRQDRHDRHDSFFFFLVWYQQDRHQEHTHFLVFGVWFVMPPHN